VTTSIEAEIRQSTPLSAESAALLSVLRTAAVLDHQIGEALKPHGITHSQYNVLRILAGSAPTGLCGREVGERMVAQVPDIPRLLERLEVMGLIRRERSTEDRRHVTAHITDKGRRLLEGATPALKQIQEARMGCLTREQLEQITALLAEVRGSIR
jgi:DNA-binding MarR family transcriptional regulator